MSVVDVRARTAVPAGVPRWRGILAILAFVAPIAAAGTFVALRWSAGAGHEPGELFGAIEVGGRSVKCAVFEVFADKEFGRDFDIKDNSSTNAELVKGMEKTGEFNPNGLEDMVTAVRGFLKRLTDAHHLPPEKIHVVGSSGLFKGIEKNKSLTAQEKSRLIETNRTRLTTLLEEAVQKKIDFVDVREETEYQIGSVVKARDRKHALFLDVGGSSTRGGCRDTAGFLKHIEGPGGTQFRDKVTSEAGNRGDFARTAANLAPRELNAVFHQQLERYPLLGQAKPIYLGGGIVWVMASYQHPENRSAYVTLTPKDIKAFAEHVVREPNLLASFQPPASLPPEEHEKLREEIKRMQEFFPPEALMAGMEILKALSTELHFEGKKLYFSRNADMAWVLVFVAEKHGYSR
jgi:hypothetical protein